MAESEEYLRMRLDPLTARRLKALEAKLELTRSTVVRQAVRDYAKRQRIPDPPTDGAPDADQP